MNNPLRTLEDYELFLYTLPERFKSIGQTTVTLVRRGATLARVAGEINFDGGFRVKVVERILTHRSPAVIDAYGYEIWRGMEKVCWYDCQPHPDEPSLQSTHPHHKHVPPDIKHHRLPALQMSFTEPNIPTLIAEVEGLIRTGTG